jgi:hypothetical protein
VTANLGSIEGGKTFVMQYGTGESPCSGQVEDNGKLATDTEKVTYAHEQGRPFYQLDEEIDTE